MAEPAAAAAAPAKKDKEEASIIAAASAALRADDDNLATVKERDYGFEHPMSDLVLVGGAMKTLPSTFHTLLQTISGRPPYIMKCIRQDHLFCSSVTPSDPPNSHLTHNSIEYLNIIIYL